MNMANELTSYPVSGPASASLRDASRSASSIETLMRDLVSRPIVARQNEAALTEILANAGVALREAAKAAADAAARARALAEGLDLMLTGLPAETASTRPAKFLASLPNDAIPLSSREREVLSLIAQGHTNKAIADALFVSPNTVKTHVTSLLRKFQADTRAQLAVLATTRGLLTESTFGQP